jgi:Ca2+-transporting ATPase
MPNMTSRTSPPVWRNNAALRYVAMLVLAASAMILALKPLRNILHFAPLETADFAFLAVVPVLVLLLCEMVKGVQNRIAERRH